MKGSVKGVGGVMAHVLPSGGRVREKVEVRTMHMLMG